MRNDNRIEKYSANPGEKKSLNTIVVIINFYVIDSYMPNGIGEDYWISDVNR